MPRSAQHQLQVGGAERALAGLVDDRLAGQRREFGNDVPAGLAAHQDAAAGPGIADAGADLPRAPALVGGQVGEVGAMAFAGVDDVVALVAHRRQQPLDRLDRRARQRQVVAHLVDIAADAAEIGLHVDDDQRGVVGPQVAVVGPGVGLGLDGSARAWITSLARALSGDREFGGRAGQRALRRAGDDHDRKRQDVGRGVEQVIARGDADRLQRRARAPPRRRTAARPTGTASGPSARRSRAPPP